MPTELAGLIATTLSLSLSLYLGVPQLHRHASAALPGKTDLDAAVSKPGCQYFVQNGLLLPPSLPQVVPSRRVPVGTILPGYQYNEAV